MTHKILLISDIHGNYPALCGIESYFSAYIFDAIINCGDSTVYAPFPNETLNWLKKKEAISILGNTDKKVIKLLQGKTFKKPGKPEKRIMYETTAKALTQSNRTLLQQFPKKSSYTVILPSHEHLLTKIKIGIYHRSPARHHEFLFDTTDDARFVELAAKSDEHIVVTGHSHTPYHKEIGNVHFINPGSVGRMFDGTPDSSCAVLSISHCVIEVEHFRIEYDIKEVTSKLKEQGLPDIYSDMFRQGRKLN